MKALTIPQPFASATVAGARTWDDRDFPLVDEPCWVAIWAGKFREDTYAKQRVVERRVERLWSQHLGWDTLPLCAIVGVVRVGKAVFYTTCREAQASPWASGPWCLPVLEAHPLRSAKGVLAPLACRGQRGLWELPAEVEQDVLGRLPHEVLRALLQNVSSQDVIVAKVRQKPMAQALLDVCSEELRDGWDAVANEYIEKRTKSSRRKAPCPK